MRREQYGPAFRFHVQNAPVQVAARSRVQARRGFVQQHHLGPVHERQRQGQPPPLPSRQGMKGRVGLLFQRKALQQGVGGFRFAVKRTTEPKRFPGRDLVLQGVRLKRRADALLHVAGMAAGVYSGYPYAPPIRPPQPQHALYRGGFARAVRTQQAKNFARRHVERNPASGGRPAVRFP